MAIAEATALVGLAKSGIELAWKWRTARREDQATREELQNAYELGARLSGSVLFELRHNVERVRYLVECARSNQFPLSPFDLTVSDAIMPRLCEVVPTPKMLGEFHFALSAIRRVDFFQRLAAQPRVPDRENPLPSRVPESAQRAISFAQDALKKGLVERFNLLRAVTAGIGEAGLPDSWVAVEPQFIPDRIDLTAAIDHGLL